MSLAGTGYTPSNTATNVRDYPPDAIVIHEEEPNDGSIYILEAGHLGVFKGGYKVSEIREPGAMFGEMAPILGTPRTATIKTITACKIAVYTGDLQQQIIEQLPSVARKLVVAMTRRLQRQTAFNANDLVRTENLEKMVKQMRRQIVDLTHQLQALSAAPLPRTVSHKKWESR